MVGWNVHVELDTMKAIKRFLLVGLFALVLIPTDASACGGGCHGGHGGGGVAVRVRVGGGGYGFMPGNPASRGYRGFGRFPLRPFATPFRPWGGLTPVRQFLFGRGRLRRMNRRAFLFGGRRYW